MTELTPGQLRYQEYLKSDDWKKKRRKKLVQLKKRRAAKCSVCGRTKDLHVHHVQYKCLVDIENRDLKMLCSRCHQIAHALIKADALGIRPKDRSRSGHISRMTRTGILFCLNLPMSISKQAVAEMEKVQPLVFDESRVLLRKQKMDIRAVNRIIRNEQRENNPRIHKQQPLATKRVLGVDGNYYKIQV
jgi:hypothetical protein